MTILLTGASGFLGRAVLRVLLARGHFVVALSRRPLAEAHPQLRTILCDLAASFDEDLIPWPEIDAVTHLAAAGVKASNRNWAEALDANVTGTQRLLEMVARRAAKRPAFMMTRTFYERLIEQSPALRENPYIATKAAATELVRIWARSYGGPVVLGTVFQLFGPGDDAGSVLSYAARQIKGGDHAVFGSGRGMRDWLYLDDAAEAVAAMLETPHSGLEEWDIGSGELTSIREMIEGMAALAGSNGHRLTFDPARDRADVDLVLKATRFFPGWSPRFSRTESLTNLLAHL